MSLLCFLCISTSSWSISYFNLFFFVSWKLIINFSKTSDFIIDFHEGYDYANKSDDTLGSTITPSETEKSLEKNKLFWSELKQLQN